MDDANCAYRPDDGTYAVQYLPLPRDARLPGGRRATISISGMVDPHDGRVPLWERTFHSLYIAPDSDEDVVAWYRWYTGHAHLFFYWCAMGHACEQVTLTIRANDLTGASAWLDRLTTLIYGSLTAMLNSGGFSTEAYRRIIRPSMVRARPDFSAGSSREHAAMMLSIQDMRDALAAHDHGGALAVSEGGSLALSQAGFRAAWATWYQHHHRLARRLEPSPDGSGVESLLDKKLKEMDEAGHHVNKQAYMAEVIRSPEAQDDYDRYFGIVRLEMVSLEDYEATLLHTLDAVRGHFSADVTDEQRAWMVQGDLLLHVLVAEQLAPRQLFRAA